MADRSDRTQGEPITPNDAIEQAEVSETPARVGTPAMPGHTAPARGHEQHTRKGQAQSPRELKHNEPPKHREGNR
jgi:hypothetical protein